METTIEYTDRKTVWINTDERSLKNRLLKLAETNSEVKIEMLPEKNNGVLCATVPHSWIKVKPPRTISDERKKSLAEALKKARSKKEENENKKNSRAAKDRT